MPLVTAGTTERDIGDHKGLPTLKRGHRDRELEAGPDVGAAAKLLLLRSPPTTEASTWNSGVGHIKQGRAFAFDARGTCKVKHIARHNKDRARESRTRLPGWDTN